MIVCMIFWVADFVIHIIYFFKEEPSLKVSFLRQVKINPDLKKAVIYDFGSNLSCRHDERKILLNLALP